MCRHDRFQGLLLPWLVVPLVVSSFAALHVVVRSSFFILTTSIRTAKRSEPQAKDERRTKGA